MVSFAAMSTPLPPAEKVCEAFGSDAHVAVALARHGFSVTADAVRKWRAPTSKGGGGGHVPSKYQGPLLLDARAQNIELTAADLVLVDERSAA
jgi:hypothetical protein